MTADRRPLGLPTFSEPPADAPVQTEGQRLLPVERALFQQEPGLDVPAPPAARRSLAAGGLAFSDPDRQI